MDKVLKAYNKACCVAKHARIFLLAAMRREHSRKSIPSRKECVIKTR